jgi:transcriptional regulator with XRE-family HTH domain
MKLNEIIAENLRKLRMERALSLGQLAELSGVSKVMLSQIEKGDTNPTINTIWKIAKGLKVPYTRLIDKAKDKTVVVRRSSCAALNTDEALQSGVCYFTTSPTRNFELFRSALDAGGVCESVSHSERSEEYILVTRGELTVEINDARYVLAEGDAVFFDATERHSYINDGEDAAEYIVINYYP